jgi:hypothetical protein
MQNFQFFYWPAELLVPAGAWHIAVAFASGADGANFQSNKHTFGDCRRALQNLCKIALRTDGAK